MSNDDDLTKDLPLEDEQAEAVTGGAAEFGDGAGDETLRNLKSSARRSTTGDDNAPNRYQVIRNDKP